MENIDMKNMPQAAINRKEHAKFATDALIHHSQTEFRFTFFDTWMVQQTPDGKVKTIKDVVAEVIVTPKHAKGFLKALEDNIRKYEKQFQEIKPPEKPPKTKVIGVTQTGTGSEAYR